jgi:hypothetical protein
MSASFEPPRDGKDDEESGIPTLYTYFGQFIDHDLTFDPASSLQQQNDPDALTDFRTPAFDLDCVYGRGPDDQPYMYDRGKSFLQGPQLQVMRTPGICRTTRRIRLARSSVIRETTRTSWTDGAAVSPRFWWSLPAWPTATASSTSDRGRDR